MFDLAMSAVGTASSTTTTVEASSSSAAAHVAAAVEAVAAAATVEAAAVTSTKALVGLGVRGVATGLGGSPAAVSAVVVRRSIVRRTSGVVAEASVGSVVYSGLAAVEA